MENSRSVATVAYRTELTDQKWDWHDLATYPSILQRTIQMKNTINQQEITDDCDTKKQLVLLTKIDQDSFWHSWQEYKNLLYSRCLIWAKGNTMMAEDLLSEVMLKAWHKIEVGEGPTRNMRGWLLRMVDRFCIDQHRKLIRRSHILKTQVIGNQETGVYQASLNPIYSVMAEELTDALDVAINNLPSRLRETSILYFRHEYSYQAIAEKQNISYANVRKRISTAKNILRNHLNNYL